MSKEMSGIEEAVALAGSQSALARRVGVSPQAVQQWVERGCVPPRRVPLVAAMTGIPAERLNPESHISHLGAYVPGRFPGPPGAGLAVCDEPAAYGPEPPGFNGKKTI